MGWSPPTTRADGYKVTSSDWNTNTVDNPTELRTGGIAIASQAANDALYAASATQLGRVAAGLQGQALLSNTSSSAPTFGVQAYPCNGRLTLTSGTAVTTSDVTAATTLYFTPYQGNRIALYDGSTGWALLTFTELNIAVPATTSTMYDVFVYNNSGTAALELLAWTNDTTRATALTLQNGVYVKTGATTRRYVGSFRTTTVSGQTEDSAAKRFVWNYYNRVIRPLQKIDAGGAYNYTSTTIRQAQGSTSYQVAVVVGVAECAVDLTLTMSLNNSTTAGRNGGFGIGVNSTTTYTASVSVTSPVAGYEMTPSTRLTHQPAAGYTFYSWLEANDASGTWQYLPARATAGIVVSGSGLTGTMLG